VSVYIYIWSIWPQIVVEHNWRSTRTHPLRELRDTPLGGHCSETIELEGRESTINSPPHLLRHPHGIHVNEWFCFGEHRNRVRRYDTTRCWESTQMRGPTTSRTERDQKLAKKACVFSLNDRMRWKWDDVYLVQGLPNILPGTLSTSVTPVYPYTLRRSLKMYLEALIERVRRCTWRR